MHISQSLLKDYIACPKRAYYRINLKEEGIQTEAMAIGSAVHKSIERDWTDLDKALNNIPGLCKEFNISLTNKKAIDKIELCIHNFHEYFAPMLSSGDDIERYFKLDYKGVKIVGVFDRVTIDGLLIDWKTSKSAPDNLPNDIQFLLYYIAYKKTYNKEPKGIIYAVLTKPQFVRFVPDPMKLQYFENVTFPFIINSIEREEFPALGRYNYSNFICHSCPFERHCYEEYKDGR